MTQTTPTATVSPAAPQRRPPASRDVVVKSAGRVLRILELFDRLRAPANAQTVACALGYPQSSASALLRSLVASGYLQYDRHGRTYMPTVRVSMLGAGWVAPRLHGASPLDQIMERLREAARATVIFAARNGDAAEELQVVSAEGEAVLPGGRRRLTTGGLCDALLATMADAEVRALLHRLNAEAGVRKEPVLRIADALLSLALVRSRGYAIGPDPLRPGTALIAIHLPLREPGGPFVLALGVDSADAEQRAPALAALMRREFAAHVDLPKPVLRWPDAAAALLTERGLRRPEGGGTGAGGHVTHAPA